MERLQQRFQLSATMTVSAAAVMFAIAEESALPALTLPVGVVALLAIDRPGRRGLPGGAALLLGGVSLVAAVSEFLLGGIEARLLAPAHFLTYLTWIVILQKKQSRQYWLLFGLCILQIAVAALLTTAAWFGLALVLFSFLALWTLSLFTMHRGAVHIEDARETEPAGGDRTHALPGDIRNRSSVRSTRQFGPQDRVGGWRFAVGTAGTSILSLMLAGLFFLYTPRIWLGRIRLFDNSALAAGLRPLTGFSEEVTLGDLGEILANEDLVLEVQLFDEDSGTAIPQEEYFEYLGSDNPLFRGMTHEYYANGRWADVPDLEFVPAPRESPERRLLRQSIRLQPTSSDILFAAGAVQACFPESGRSRIRYNPETYTYVNGARDAGSVEFAYAALSIPRRVEVAWEKSETVDYWDACERVNRGTERLSARAVEIAASANGGSPIPASEIADRLSPTEIAEILTIHLRDSGEFEYSLSLAVDDPSIDPLEDFYFNRKLGHCEYFSSALAIMLRADEFAAPVGDGRGLATRLVVGFKGGGFNPETGRFEVRQLHAHSWVEAYLDERWVPLDPTPPARDLTVANLDSTTSTGIARWRRAWEAVWNRGVGLSREEQQQLLYDPLETSALEAWSALHDVRGSSARLGGFLRSLVESPERWFSWRGGVTVFVLMTIIALLIRLLRRMGGIFQLQAGSSHRSRRARASVPFLERFTRIVNRVGLRREEAQTPLEFAEQAQHQLSATLLVAGTPGLPEEIAETFYRVRFGNHPVSAAESAALEERLDSLEDALQRDGAAETSP